MISRLITVVSLSTSFVFAQTNAVFKKVDVADSLSVSNMITGQGSGLYLKGLDGSTNMAAEHIVLDAGNDLLSAGVGGSIVLYPGQGSATNGVVQIMDGNGKLALQISEDGTIGKGVWHIDQVITDGSLITNLAVNSGDIVNQSISNVDIAANAGIAISKVEDLESVLAGLQARVDAIASNHLAAASITVSVTSDDVQNGINLTNAYAQARSMNPSSLNRVAVIVPPGRYDLGAAGLTMDTEFVDLIGQTGDRSAQYLYGSPDISNGVIKQVADYVCIESLTLVNFSPSKWGFDGSDPAAYLPTVDGENTIIRNCEFAALDGWNFSMGIGSDYAGYYERCKAGVLSFGFGGSASGTFIDCTCDSFSFASYGIASGTFINCKGGTYSFGSNRGTISNSAVFVSCSADDRSFGVFNTASDNFNYNTSGHHFQGAPVSGDGSRLTNLDINSTVGTLNIAQLPPLTVAELPVSGTWEATNLAINSLCLGDISGEVSRDIDQGAAHYYYKPVFKNGVVSFEPLARKDGIIQSLGAVSGKAWKDEIGGAAAELVDGPCLQLSAGDYILFTDCAGVSNVINAGTAILDLDVTGNRVNVVSSGTLYDLHLNEFHYPVSENGGAIIHDVSGMQNHGEIAVVSGSLDVAWSARQDDYHYSLNKGFSKALYFETDRSNERVQSGVGVGDSTFTAYQLFQPNEWNSSAKPHNYMGSSQYLKYGWMVGAWKGFSSVYLDFQRPGASTLSVAGLSLNQVKASDAHHLFVRVDITNNYAALNLDDQQRISSRDLSSFVPPPYEVLFMHGRQGGWTTPGGNLYRCAYWNRKLSDEELDAVKNGYPDDVPEGLIFYRDEARGIEAGVAPNGDPCDIPAQNDSGLDVCNSPLTNPGGNFHNGAPSKIRQSEENSVLKIADGGFWYNSNGAANAITYEQLASETSRNLSVQRYDRGAVGNVITYAEGTNGEALASSILLSQENSPTTISTENQEFTVHAENGFYFSGGSIKGDGSGLTDLDLSNYVGNNLTWESNKLHAAVGYSDSAAVTAVQNAWTNLMSEVEVDDMVSDNGFASDVALVAHVTGAGNPHQVTATQVGAYTTDQTEQAIVSAVNGIQLAASNLVSGTISRDRLPSDLGSSVDLAGINGINVDVEGSSATASIDTNYFYNVLFGNVPPMGDLSMGAFTNRTVQLP